MKIVLEIPRGKAQVAECLLRKRYGKDKRTKLATLARLAVTEAASEQALDDFFEKVQEDLEGEL